MIIRAVCNGCIDEKTLYASIFIRFDYATELEYHNNIYGKIKENCYFKY